MRILIIANLYPDSRQPAFGTFVAAHAAALRRAGADVSVVAIAGVPVHRDVVRKYLWLALRTIGHAVRSRIRRERTRIVEAHVAYPTALLAWVAARLLGAALVIYCHGSDVTGVAARSRLHHAIAKWVFARADLVAPNSAFLGELLETRYNVSPDRVAVLSPGVDLTRFSPRARSRRLGEILYVGWLSRGKGVFQLVEAVRELGDRTVTLRIVGDGPERATLQEAALAAGVRAEFHGALRPTEVAAFLNHAAVVAMPSTNPEGLGLVALEAMAAGALVVASSAGGIAESVIDGETGWLVPPGDVAALAAALADALSAAAAADASRRTAIKRRAMLKVREHDIDAIARRTLHLYESLRAVGRA